MTKQELFNKAHEIARQTKTAAGSYRIAFACALKDLYAGLYEQKDTETKLVELGLRVWEKAGMRRIYVNASHLKEVFNVRFALYKNSGRPSYFCIGDETLSNTKGYAVLTAKCYYDCLSKTWCHHEALDGALAL